MTLSQMSVPSSETTGSFSLGKTVPPSGSPSAGPGPQSTKTSKKKKPDTTVKIISDTTVKILPSPSSSTSTSASTSPSAAGASAMTRISVDLLFAAAGDAKVGKPQDLAAVAQPGSSKGPKPKQDQPHLQKSGDQKSKKQDNDHSGHPKQQVQGKLKRRISGENQSRSPGSSPDVKSAPIGAKTSQALSMAPASSSSAMSAQFSSAPSVPTKMKHVSAVIPTTVPGENPPSPALSKVFFAGARFENAPHANELPIPSFFFDDDAPTSAPANNLPKEPANDFARVIGLLRAQA